MEHYIDAKKFEDFASNQRKLIDILNHRMTKLEVDVKWMQKIMSIQTGLLTGIFICLITLVFKLL